MSGCTCGADGLPPGPHESFCGQPEVDTDAVATLTALVGTVCPACQSFIEQSSDGTVRCFDWSCGQQLDAYRALVSS